MDKKTVIAETEKYYLPVFGRYQMVMELGQGCRVWDSEGNEYVDAFAGIAVNSLGYNHPVLVKAIAEQAAKLMHCSNRSRLLSRWLWSAEPWPCACALWRYQGAGGANG